MGTATLKKRSTALALIALALGLGGCAGISENTHAYLGSPEFRAANPNLVEILSAAPTRPAYRLGEVILSMEGNPSRGKLEARLKTAAARLGADAVFVVSDRTHVFPIVYWDYWGPGGMGEEYRRSIVAVAVKYK